MLAQRTSLFTSSGTAAARAAAKAAGREVIDLASGEIWTDLAPTIREGAIAAINRGVNRYTETVGLEALREAIARRLSIETGQLWGVDEVAMTTGAKQALFNTAMVLLNPDDEVLIPAPYWTTFAAQVSIAGARPVFIDTRRNGYLPDLNDLEAAITPTTRAIIVNTPGNPTGAVYDEPLLAGVAKLAGERKLWIIFDECYSSFAHPPWYHRHILSVAPEARPRTLTVNAFSKQLGITGWRIGYVAGPREVIDAVKALQSHTTSNPNVIAQHAALHHLESTDGSFERHLAAGLELARARGLSILSGLSRVPLPTAQGGFYFYLDLSLLLKASRLPNNGLTADDVARALLRDAAVASVPGTAFGDPFGLRLSYGVPLDLLDRGLRSAVDTLNAWSWPSEQAAAVGKKRRKS